MRLAYWETTGIYRIQMAQKALREPQIDTELTYVYAKTDRLRDMEDFLKMISIVDILEVGEVLRG
jgi:hypothetical protein